jgi:hypothetical protein
MPEQRKVCSVTMMSAMAMTMKVAMVKGVAVGAVMVLMTNAGAAGGAAAVEPMVALRED